MLTRLDQEYTLRAQDVDIKGEWMPSAIFTRMQEIAEDHAACVGWGREHIVEKLGCGWVLTRMNLEMERYPGLGEKITVSTWPCKPTKFIFRRQFLFCAQDGSELGKASSQWVLFDIAERMLRRTDAVGEYPFDPLLPQIVEEPRKLALPADMERAAEREVLYSDVDMNRHMNNTKYLNWICELFPPKILEEKRISRVKINYIAEAQLGQRVELFRSGTEDGCYICGNTDGKTVFDAFVRFIYTNPI